MLSLCMIVKDEEKRLPELLESVKDFVDEIIVVDTGSTDNTKQIATSFGAKVFEIVWIDDFSIARNISLEKATGDWILVLDADEKIESEDLEKIKKILENPTIDAFKLKVINHMPNKAEVVFNLVRLFRNNPEYRYEGKVHETIESSIKSLDGKIVPLEVSIHHYGHLDSNLKKKAEFYKELVNKQLKETPDDVRALHLAAQSEPDVDKALEYLHKITKINPSYKNVWFTIATTEIKKGNSYAAIHAFKQSLENNPESANAPQATNNLAVLYAKSGQKQKALQVLERALKKWPDNMALKANHARITNVL